MLRSPQSGFTKFLRRRLEEFISRRALFGALHAVEHAAVFLVKLLQPIRTLASEGFVLLDGEQDGARFFVPGDGHGLLGGDLLEDVGGGVFELGGSDRGEFLDAGAGVGVDGYSVLIETK